MHLRPFIDGGQGYHSNARSLCHFDDVALLMSWLQHQRAAGKHTSICSNAT